MILEIFAVGEPLPTGRGKYRKKTIRRKAKLCADVFVDFEVEDVLKLSLLGIRIEAIEIAVLGHAKNPLSFRARNTAEEVSPFPLTGVELPQEVALQVHQIERTFVSRMNMRTARRERFFFVFFPETPQTARENL